MVEEHVGENHATQPRRAMSVEQSVVGERLEDLRTEAADRAFLDCDQDFVVRGQTADQIAIDRLGEACIRHRGRNTARGKVFRGLLRFGKAGSERQQRHRRALANDAAAADLERDAALRHLDADAFATRVTQRGGALVIGRLRRNHVDEIGLIGGGHDHEFRQAAEIGEIERARMRRAVSADETGAVHRKAHRQLLDRDVVHDLVVGALQEGRVDRNEGLVALGR